MKPTDFVKKYLPFAKLTEQKTGINAYIILAQSALETGWGESAPGNMMFGVKDWDGINGNEQLITTFEFHKNPNLTPKQIGLHTIEKVEVNLTQSKAAGVTMYKYTGKAYFRKYNTPEESFTDHAKVFNQKNFAAAMKLKANPDKFIEAVAPIYAQSPSYANLWIDIYNSIKNIK